MRVTRRRLLGLLGGTAATVAGCSAPRGDTGGWRQLRATPGRTGHNADATGPGADPTAAWTVRAAGQLSAPVVAGSHAYVSGGTRNQGTTTALGATAGDRAWRATLPVNAGIPPAAGPDSLYVPGRFGVYAFDRAGGEPAWTHSRGRQVANAVGLAAGGDRLYAGFRSRTAPYEAVLCALDTATGESVWEAPVGRDNVLLFAPSAGGGLVTAGKERLYALDAATGDRRWTVEAPDAHFGTPVVADGVVYAGATTADRTGFVVALDAADGAERWRVETALGARSLAFDGGTVFVASDTVYAVDAATGRVRWTAGTNRFALSPPSVAGDTVYLGGVDGTVLALATSDGRERWRLTTQTLLTSSPAVVGDAAYVAGRNGVVHRLD